MLQHVAPLPPGRDADREQVALAVVAQDELVERDLRRATRDPRGSVSEDIESGAGRAETTCSRSSVAAVASEMPGKPASSSARLCGRPQIAMSHEVTNMSCLIALLETAG